MGLINFNTGKTFEGLIPLSGNNYPVSSLLDLKPYCYYDIGLSGLPDGLIYTINDLSGNNNPATYYNYPATKNGDKLFFSRNVPTYSRSVYQVLGLNFANFEATIGFRLSVNYHWEPQGTGSTVGPTSNHWEWYPNNYCRLGMFRGSGLDIRGKSFPFGERQIIYESSHQRYNIYLDKGLYISQLPHFGYSSLVIGGSGIFYPTDGYLKKCVIFNRILRPWEMGELMRLL